jgi:hypothetical protein
MPLCLAPKSLTDSPRSMRGFLEVVSGFGLLILDSARTLWSRTGTATLEWRGKWRIGWWLTRPEYAGVVHS